MVADLGVEEAAVQAVDLQLLTLRLRECDERVILTGEAISRRLNEQLERHGSAEDEDSILAECGARPHWSEPERQAEQQQWTDQSGQGGQAVEQQQQRCGHCR